MEFDKNIHQPIQKIIKYEDSLNSIDKGFTSYNLFYDEDFSDMIPTLDKLELKARLFQRTNDSFIPKLVTWYFYNKDSVVQGCFYRWAFYNPDFNPSKNLKILEDQKKRLPDYKAKYKKIKKQLTDIFGEMTNSKIISNSKTHYIEHSIWDNKTYRIVLLLDFNPNIMTIPGTDYLAGGDSEIIMKFFFK